MRRGRREEGRREEGGTKLSAMIRVSTEYKGEKRGRVENRREEGGEERGEGGGGRGGEGRERRGGEGGGYKPSVMIRVAFNPMRAPNPRDMPIERRTNKTPIEAKITLE
jgi:hypothetical protein